MVDVVAVMWGCMPLILMVKCSALAHCKTTVHGSLFLVWKGPAATTALAATEGQNFTEMLAEVEKRLSFSIRQALN